MENIIENTIEKEQYRKDIEKDNKENSDSIKE